MTRFILRTLLPIALSAAIGPIALKAQGCITAKIPFDFIVGKQSLAAGEYCVRPTTPDVLSITEVNGRSTVMTLTLPADTKQDGKAVLTFKHYGDSYFLYQVAGPNRAWQFHQSPAEKDLLAKKAQPTPVTLAGVVTPK